MPFARFRHWRALRASLLALLLLLALLHGRAWDGDVMLAAAQRLGGRTPVATQALQTLTRNVGALNDEAKVAAFNQFFNRHIAYADDLKVWGVTDYWASPLESLSKGAGDCEDYAIAKYFSLHAAGVPVARMRLVYVRAVITQRGLQTSQAHMVLAYYASPQADPLILDNLVEEVLPASKRSDLTPVFSFNSDSLWMGAAPQATSDSVSRLSRWREVLAKAQAEGFF